MGDSNLTNDVLPGSIGSAQDLPLPNEDRFACLPGCGLCCSYRVLVTKADRSQLREAGRLTDDPQLSGQPVVGLARPPWETDDDGKMALRRLSGFCVFLDSEQRCSVYDHRPERCRAYPFLWTTYVRREPDVDFSCPGLGRGATVPLTQRQPPAESATKQTQRDAAIGQIRGLLRAQGRYAAPNVLAALGERCLDKLTTVWASAPRMGSSSARVEQTSPLLANAETEDASPTLWEGLSLSLRPVGEVCRDNVFMKRHFAQPRLNTRLGHGGAVVVYRHWIASWRSSALSAAQTGAFHTEEREGTHREISLGQIGRIPWGADALATRRAYLERWSKRQLAARLANNLAVAHLARSSHVATLYLQFMMEIDQRLAVLAPALAMRYGKTAIDRNLALESIRGSDNVLRAWCESAQLSRGS